MSLHAEKKHLKTELKAGVHLVSIFDMKLNLDQNKQPIQKDGEMAILVTFVTGTNPNLYHEQVYWIGKGNAGKERHFTQMCLDAMIDMSITPLPKKAALNKRLWIAIREVFTLVDNGENIKKDIVGNDVIEHFIFHTAPIWDVEKQPTWKGDPLFNDGIACDDFVGYKEDNEDGYATVSNEEASPFTLNIIQSTPEVEKEVVEKPKKVRQVKLGNNGKLESEIVEIVAPNFGESNIEKAKEIITEQRVKVVGFPLPTEQGPTKQQIDSLSSTPMPNFSEPVDVKLVATDVRPIGSDIKISEDGKSATIEMPAVYSTEVNLSISFPNFGEATPTSDSNEVLTQDNKDQTPLPEFDSNQTPDQNF